MDTDQGLLSPVVHNAGDLSLAGLSRAINDIAARARSGDLKPDELSGGTFTITNIGSQGALFDTPILVPPQAAMLGTGAIVKRRATRAFDTTTDLADCIEKTIGRTGRIHPATKAFQAIRMVVNDELEAAKSIVEGALVMQGDG